MFGTVSLLVAATLAQPPYAARRTAALERLDGRLLIVPSRSSFKSDDQAAFQQASDFQYLTGHSDLVGAVLVLDPSAKASILFVSPPHPAISRPVPVVGAESARRLGLSEVVAIDSLAARLGRWLPKVKGVAVSSTDLRGAVSGPAPIAGTVDRWKAYLTALGWKGDVSSAVSVVGPLREIKDAGELAIFERVGRMSGQAMLVGIRALEPGKRQRAVEIAVVESCVAAGGVHSFWPWAMSGPRAVFTDLFNSFVDYQGHDRVMKAGELVRVDVGCQADHYMGDVGRTAPVSGRFDPGQREAWDLFIAGYQAGRAAIRGGVRASEILRLGLERIRQLQPGLKTPMGRQAAEILLGPGGIVAWQIHGVGLDDAEGQPEVLKARMTVAYELMFAVGEHGFYLEDMIAVEANGHRLLTPGLPYTAAEIEAAMRRR